MAGSTATREDWRDLLAGLDATDKPAGLKVVWCYAAREFTETTGWRPELPARRQQ